MAFGAFVVALHAGLPTCDLRRSNPTFIHGLFGGPTTHSFMDCLVTVRSSIVRIDYNRGNKDS